MNNNRLFEILRSHKSICWYPSAGCDFRPLLFLTKQYYSKKDELKNISEIPDLFVLTDFATCYIDSYFNPLYTNGILLYTESEKIDKGTISSGDCLYKDDFTTVTVKNVEKFSTGFCDSVPDENDKDSVIIGSPSPQYGMGYYMNVHISSRNPAAKKLGEYDVKMLFLYSVNHLFAKELLKEKIGIDYIIKIRYGGNMGNSKASKGEWLNYVLKPFGVKYYIDYIYERSIKENDYAIISELEKVVGEKLSVPDKKLILYDAWSTVRSGIFVEWFKINQN